MNCRPVRSVMDQHRSFPRVSKSAGSQEGWHPARRSIVLLSQLPSRKLTSIHPQHCQRCGILDAHLCHHAGIGPPANAPPTGQRTNDRDLILIKVSVGRVVFASPHRGLVGWLSLTVLTQPRNPCASQVSVGQWRCWSSMDSGESYTQLFGPSIHSFGRGKPLGGSRPGSGSLVAMASPPADFALVPDPWSLVPCPWPLSLSCRQG